MDAAFILDSLRRHHAGAAIVPEITIDDDHWLDYWAPGMSTASTRRIDALMWQARQITAIEIKVSIADFDRDDWRKRLPWQRVSHRFVYAVPAGLLEARRPVPHGCGLWEVHDDGTVKATARSKINNCPEPLPLSVVQNLAYRASRRPITPDAVLPSPAQEALL